MDILLVVLAGVAALAAIIAAVGAWKSKAARDPEALAKLADVERRLGEQFDRLRETFDSGLRDLGERQLRAQMEFQDKLTASIAQLGDRMNGFGDKQTDSFKAFQESVRASLDQMREKSDASNAAARKELADALAGLRKSSDDSREAQTATLKQLEQATVKKLDELRDKNLESFSQLQEGVRAGLDRMRAQNEEKLEKIRLTVDEKLQTTLETRLGESFKLVSERLEQVHKGLGEMQTLASGVGDLKRVLTNVRSRGTFGEVQLAALLEQIMTPTQYAKNVATVPNSNERVEFAIILPGKSDEDGAVFLPIDAKFPQEDYLRLQEAYEAGDVAALEAARRGLEIRLLGEARKIHEKYVSPPHTTDFALLFLPTEGLYAEALRLPGVVERIQRECQVIITGPTTLYAVLSSLQMGFRTLAIEKRSSEVWKVLGAIKTEFGKFGESLDAVKKKLQEASNKIEFSARRSRAVERKLRDVQQLPVEETGKLLGEEVEAEVDEEPVEE